MNYTPKPRRMWRLLADGFRVGYNMGPTMVMVHDPPRAPRNVMYDEHRADARLIAQAPYAICMMQSLLRHATERPLEPIPAHLVAGMQHIVEEANKP